MNRADQELIAAAFRVAELAADGSDTTSAVEVYRQRRDEHQEALAAFDQ